MHFASKSNKKQRENAEMLRAHLVDPARMATTAADNIRLQTAASTSA
jgi:hypothetical protein